MKYLLSFRRDITGGPVMGGQLIEEAGLGTRATLQLETAVTVLLHGFNVNLRKGRKSLEQFADMLSASNTGALIATLWPGDHWTGPFSYAFEGRDADDTAKRLATYLNDILRPDAEISFIGHSLGCRVTMETITRLISVGRLPTQVCLMAPAIDEDSLAAPNEYLAATRTVGRVAVLSSRKDTVLRYAYPAGDLLQAFLFAEDSADSALGLRGARRHKKSGTAVPANVLNWRIRSDKGVRHRDYFPKKQEDVDDEDRPDRWWAAADFADAVISGIRDPVYR